MARQPTILCRKRVAIPAVLEPPLVQQIRNKRARYSKLLMS
jgi:hypothetical protein